MFNFELHAQDLNSDNTPADSIPTGTLLLYTGDTIAFKLIEQTERILRGLKMKGDLWSLKSYPKESVFKYSDKNIDVIYYSNRILIDNPMTKTEMEQFILGKKTAKYEYNSRSEFFKGFTFGLVLSMIDTYEFRNVNDRGFFNNSASWLTITSPMWSTVLIRINLNQLNRNRNLLEIENLEACYYQGFDQVFLWKNSRSIVGGSILGASLVVAIKILLD